MFSRSNVFLTSLRKLSSNDMAYIKIYSASENVKAVVNLRCIIANTRINAGINWYRNESVESFNNYKYLKYSLE